MFLIRWLFQSLVLALVTRVLGRFFPVLIRLFRVFRR